MALLLLSITNFQLFKGTTQLNGLKEPYFCGFNVVIAIPPFFHNTIHIRNHVNSIMHISDKMRIVLQIGMELRAHLLVFPLMCGLTPLILPLMMFSNISQMIYLQWLPVIV